MYKVSLKRDLTNLSLHCTGTVVDHFCGALLVAFGMPVDSKVAGDVSIDVSIASVDIPNGACDGNVMS